MHLLFVYPNFMRQENISLGIASLSAYLKAQGHTTALVDYTWGGTTQTTLDAVARSHPALVAFSVRSGEYERSLAIAAAIRRRYGVRPLIVFGGVHPTVAPDEVIGQDAVDFVCIGEGEAPLGELCRRLDSGGDTTTIPGIWAKRGAAVIRNQIAPPIADLDTLPHPDRELFDIRRYIASRNGGVDIMSSRGCPYDCTYCINAHLHALYAGKAPLIRKRSVAHLIDEIAILVDRYGARRLFFQDDFFTAPLSWVRDFANAFTGRFALTYSCSTRPEAVTPELCEHLKRSGCTNVCIGIESGSERIRREVLGRHISNEVIARAFRMCADAGLPSYSYNMVGLPHETPADIDETIRLNREVRPTFLQVSIFQPYPGTRLHALCAANGWIAHGRLPYSHQFSSMMRYPHLSARAIYWQKVTFRYRVLKESAPAKALAVLAYDLLFVWLTAIRHRIPDPLKTAANRLLEGFLKK